MREHLFRGRRIDNGEWVYGGIKTVGTDWFIIARHGKVLDFNHEVIPETVGQHTGLKDKNGDMIFEGDIVSYYQPYSERTDIHIVGWDEPFACFALFEKGNQWAKEMDWMKIQDIEIIGNIHDTPAK